MEILTIGVRKRNPLPCWINAVLAGVFAAAFEGCSWASTAQGAIAEIAQRATTPSRSRVLRFMQ
jgi:hypothetical protein